MELDKIEIRRFVVHKDNYAALVINHLNKTVIAIDAPDAGPIIDVVKSLGYRMSAVLVTHHHYDHTDGLVEIKPEMGGNIYAPQAEAAKIPQADFFLKPEVQLNIEGIVFKTIETAGHTAGHLSFYSEMLSAVFTGDALFELGCGRLLEESAEVAFAGLQRLRALPAGTRVFCGHDYTAANAKFALTVESDNAALQERARNLGAVKPVPTLAEEFNTNPFLRGDSASIRRTLNMDTAAPAKVFEKLRLLKDQFAA